MAQAARKLPQASDSEKLHEIDRTAKEPFAADLLPRMMTEITELCRSSTQTAMECFEVASTATQEVSEDAMQACNRTLAECAEISKAAFGCRTINDVIGLQNRLMKLGTEQGFGESGKLLTKGFECYTAMLKPLQDYVAQASDTITKAFSDKR